MITESESMGLTGKERRFYWWQLPDTLPEVREVYG